MSLVSHSDKVKLPLRPSALKDCHDILTNAPIGIFASTPEGRFIDANPALANLYGYSSVQELLDSITDIATQTFVDPADRKIFISQIENHGRLVSHECRQRRRDGSIFWAAIYARAVRDHIGAISHYQGFTADISDRKQAEEMLEKRMMAMKQPLEQLEDVSIEDLFTIKELQHLQDDFAEATGVASIITQVDGTPVTRPSNFCRFCSDIIRTSEAGRANCFHSDAMIGRACTNGPTIQLCLSGGLWDAGAGITIGGRHIANWLIGQVRDETQPEEKIIAYAREIGVDEEMALEAYRQIPTMSYERFGKIAHMLFTLASQLSSSAYQNVQQDRFINKARRAELALRESESRLKSVFRSAPIGIGVVINRVIIQVNRRLCEITGYNPEELVDHNARMLYLSDEEYDFVGQRKYDLIREHGTGTVETRWRRRDGAAIDILLSSTPIDLTDLSKGVTFTALDITDRKRSREALRQSEAKLSSYANQMEQFSLSATSMISLKDEKDIYRRISKAIVDFSDFRRVLISLFKDEAPYRDIIGHGGVPDELVEKLEKIPMPKTWYDHVFSQGLRLGQFSYYIPHTMKHILNQMATVYGEGPAPEDDSTWHPEDNLFVRLNDETGELIGVISVDDSKSGQKPSLETIRPLEIYAGLITQIIILKREQARRERLEEQLGMARKMESVGRLAGGVAHDFNNMLGVILGYSEMALEQVEVSEPIHSALHEIQKAAERSANLTRQLLAFARKQTIAPRLLDFNATLEGMLGMLRRLIGEDIDLIWLPGKNLGQIKMDPSQTDQILANLCVNARDAIAGNAGKITIETSNVGIDASYTAQHPGSTPGDYVLLAVSDNGCGMDDETLSHLFEPFFTTKATGKGTGLGLATVYGIVKQNNGFIHVYSEQARGTTFRIYMPRYSLRVEEIGMADGVASDHPVEETILLVEDEPMILAMAQTMLKRRGYTVLAAATPGEALRIAQHYEGIIDILMTDVIMPEMNGHDLAGNLLSVRPQLKCLFMSGYTANVIAHHGVLNEGVHFIQKPFTKRDLLDKIRAVLDGALD